MAKFNFRTSIKHLEINKANTMIVVACAVATVIVVFAAVASISLGKDMSYKNKVINLRNKANKQLLSNITAANSLDQSYQAFESSSESVIGTSDDNAKIVLDALPSKYDFPAFITSLEWMITNSGSTISGITGTDNEATAAQNSIDPQPVVIPFQISTSGTYTNAQSLISELQRSIRPIQITSLTFSGSDTNLTTTISAQTYYQPEKQLGIQQSVVTNSSSSTGAKK